MNMWIVYLHEGFFLKQEMSQDSEHKCHLCKEKWKPYIYVKACNTVVNILMQCEVVFILDNRAEATFAKLGCIC